MGFRWVLVSVAAVVGPDADRPRCCSVGRRGSARGDLQDRLRPARAARHDGSGAREHAGVLVAARPDLRPADELPGQGGVTGIRPGARGRRGAAEDVAGRKDVHVHAQAWLPVQRRKAGRCPGVRARDQPHADTGPEVAGHPVHAGHRRRPRRAGGYSGECQRSGRAGIPPRHPPRATASATSPRARACRSSAPSRRTSPPIRRVAAVPGLRPVLRLGVPARPAGHARAKSLLPRQAAAPCRRIQRRPDRRLPRTTCSTASRTGAPTGGSSRRPSTSAPTARSSGSTASTSRSSSSGPGSRSGRSCSTRASPLFRDNPELRRAVNYAVDRTAFTGNDPGTHITDQFLPPSLPGFRDANIYPLGGPDLAKAERSRAGTCGAARPPSTSPTCRSRSPWARC